MTVPDPAPEPGQSPGRSYHRLSPLTPLVRSAILVVAVAVSSWDDLLRGAPGPIGIVALALLVVGAVVGTASWLRTKYWIEADELRVDTGLVSRQSRRIRVDRIQGIDVVQPFVARLLGLAELRMDVAGGGAREGSLAFLRLSEAEALREKLLSRRDAVRAGESGSGPDAVAQQGSPHRVVARLDLRTLVVSLVLSPTTVGFLVSSAALGGLFLAMGGIGGFAGAVPLVIGWGITQFRRLSAFYDFTVTTTGDPGAGNGAGTGGRPDTGQDTVPGVHVRRGLFERSAQTVALERVQGVVVTEPWMWSPMGWARLDVSVAGQAHGGQGGNEPSLSTVMPVAPRAEVLDLARLLLSVSSRSGSADLRDVRLTRPPTRARWVAPVRRRFLAVGVGEHLVVSAQGVLGRRTHAVPHERVQSLQLHQRPWQRFLGLADVGVDSPPGPVAVRARHRDAEEARRLLEQLSEATRRARLSGS